MSKTLVVCTREDSTGDAAREYCFVNATAVIKLLDNGYRTLRVVAGGGEVIAEFEHWKHWRLAD